MGSLVTWNLWFALSVECHRITQNHRMVGVGRDLCGSSSPTPLLKQGHLQQARPEGMGEDMGASWDAMRGWGGGASNCRGCM